MSKNNIALQHTCYMCDDNKTSVEHVPPKCLFPEQKDVDGCANYRVDLITVPSCDLHNSNKSKNDEYLMFLLVSALGANSIASDVQVKKLLRAVNRIPGLYNSIFPREQDVLLLRGDKYELSSKIEVDQDRINSCFDSIARGIFFHEYGNKFTGSIKFVSDFLYYFDGRDSQNINVAKNRVLLYCEHDLESLEYKGSNQSVFRYKVKQCDDNVPFKFLLKLSFYEGLNVYAVLK